VTTSTFPESSKPPALDSAAQSGREAKRRRNTMNVSNRVFGIISERRRYHSETTHGFHNLRKPQTASFGSEVIVTFNEQTDGTAAPSDFTGIDLITVEPIQKLWPATGAR
jgi:hypothetical protein